MNKSNLKKILILTLLIIGTGIIIYFIWFSNSSNPIDKIFKNNSNSSPSSTLPSANNGNNNVNIANNNPNLLPNNANNNIINNGVGNNNQNNQNNTTANNRDNKILESVLVNAALSPSLSPDGSGLVYFDRYDNKFYKLDSNGTRTALSDKVFYEAKSVSWAPDKNKAVITFPDESKIVYNFSTERQTTLQKNWVNPQFSPGSDKLVFVSDGNNASDRWISVVNADGSNAKAIEAVGDNAYKVINSWSPSSQIIALMTDAQDANNQLVYFIGQNKENFPALTVTGRAFQSQWSQTGSELLYSVSTTDGNKPQLWLTAGSGDNLGSLQMNLNLNTWSNKCTFGNNQIFCAVPRILPEGSGTFQALASDSADDLYVINSQTGEKSQLDPNGSFNMQNLVYSEKDHAIYFIDSLEGKMHKLNLP